MQSWGGRAATLAWRAIRLRCPQCGGADAFLTWFRMRPACPTCGLDFERREQGYIVGAYMLNIVGAELLFLAGLLVVLATTWPTPPWGVLRFVAPAMMLVTPLLTYPFSKTAFLALDLAFRPGGTE
jgi:uncharacterized protein (DUF983 family)